MAQGNWKSTGGTSLTDANYGGAVISGSGTAIAPKIGLRFTSETGSTADSDPGAGLFKWNNASQASATMLYLDTTEIGGVDVSDRIKLLAQGQIVRIEQEDDSTKWQEWLLQGIVSASGYYKLSVILIKAGASLDDNKSCRILPMAVSQGYYGSLSGDVTAVTYNSDGSVATITIGGLAWTLAYNSNGSLATETIVLAGDDLVRTYAYDANGRFTGVSGAVERMGAIVMTSAQAADLKTPLTTAGAAAAGFRAWVTDLGQGNELVWKTTYWAPSSTNGIELGRNMSAVASDTNGTINESSALRTVVVPGWLNSAFSWIEAESGWNFTGVNNTKTARSKLAGTSFHAMVHGASNLSATQRARFHNRAATNSQIGTHFSAASAGLGGSSSALHTAATDTTANQNVTFTVQCASGTDTATLEYVIVRWGAA